MKKIFTSLCYTAAIASASFAQVCTPDQNTPAGSFSPTYDLFTCVTPNQQYSGTISIKIPAAVTSPPAPANADIDSIEFVSIGNLPCGLTATLNRVSKRYSKNELGCIQISGKTTDVAGQYKLDIQMLAWLTGSSSSVGPVSTDLAALSYYVRVKDAQGNCPIVNTADPGNTAATSCPLGLTETAKTLKGIRVQPNPMNQFAKLSFESEKSGIFTINTIDMIGKIVSTTSVNVIAGLNTITMERADLPQGVYFINITNGKETATQKFIIAD